MVISLFIIPANAHAYLDLGTAGYLVQIILAVLAGALFSVKIFWSKIRLFFGKVFSRKGHKDKDSNYSGKDIAEGK